jgi:hypothetical protein
LNNVINNPPISGLLPALATWMTQVYIICFSIQESGTTAQRPTKNLWLFRRYGDKTIGKPIWWNGTIWILADGTAA